MDDHGGGTLTGNSPLVFTVNPTATTAYSVQSATEANGCAVTAPGSATVTVNTATAITTQPSSQSKTVGQSVSFSVTATGSNLSYQWRKNNVNLPSATASSYNIPAVELSDAAQYDVAVTGACGSVTSSAATLTVNCPSITLAPATLPDGALNASYSQTLTATGGAAPYSFALASGSLPNGLMLNNSGTLGGTPTASGAFNLTLRMTDALGCSSTQSYSLTLIGCPTISLGALPQGTAGVQFNQTISVTPSGTYSFALVQGNLPAGLTLNRQTGTISGRASVTGSYNFTLKATAANG